jgi:hypothetical protein
MARNDVVNSDGSLNIDRLGQNVDDINDHTSQLAEKAPLNPNISTITELPQSPMPTKSGIQESGHKIIIKNSDGFYQVIQKTNKNYLLYDLKTNVGGSGTSDTGGTWELLRPVRVKPVPAAYVYLDNYTTTGTVTNLYAEGDYSTPESELFKFYSPVVINEYKASKTANGGLRCVGVKSADGTAKFTIPFKMTKVNKGNILYLASTTTSQNCEITVNGKVVKTFDSSCTTGSEWRIIEFDLPVKYSDDTITVEVLNKDASSKSFYLVCANFKELKDYNGEYINHYKAFIDTAAYIDSTGANDYAIYDNATQKYVGSYHGGETLVDGKLRWVSSDRFDIEARSIETTITNTYVDGSFVLMKDFNITQRTNLNNKGEMISKFDFSVDGTLGMTFSWIGDITSDFFYTSLTATHKDFTRVTYPKFIQLGDSENLDYLLDLTDGMITQVNPTAGLKMDIRFNKWESAYTGKQAWIKSLSTSYRKAYYGFVNKTNQVKKVAFRKSLDFYRN